MQKVFCRPAEWDNTLTTSNGGVNYVLCPQGVETDIFSAVILVCGIWELRTISQTVPAWMKLGYYSVYVWPARSARAWNLLSVRTLERGTALSVHGRTDAWSVFPCQLVSFCVTADVYADSINFFWFTA